MGASQRGLVGLVGDSRYSITFRTRAEKKQTAVTFATWRCHINMKPMHEISRTSRTVWLRTDRPVVTTKTTDWRYLLEVQNALQHGLFATADSKRPEFFEIDIQSTWYYIHIPSRIAGIYLIAARRQPKTSRHRTRVATICF